jgi:fructose/tagatose bisphosphate aldolase
MIPTDEDIAAVAEALEFYAKNHKKTDPDQYMTLHVASTILRTLAALVKEKKYVYP